MKNTKMKLAVATAFLSTLMASAHAAIDPAVSTALTAIETDASSLNALVVPIVISVLGMFIVIKLIKRFSNKI